MNIGNKIIITKNLLLERTCNNCHHLLKRMTNASMYFTEIPTCNLPKKQKQKVKTFNSWYVETKIPKILTCECWETKE